MRPFLLPLLTAATLALSAVTLSAPTALAQANTCQWANDNECDEGRYNGTGACDTGTDANDCRAEAAAMDRLIAAIPADLRGRLGGDTCRWAFDRECDDAAFGGTGACTAGTDLTDCRAMAIGGDDTCRWANDGECDEPNIGTGVCTSGTDATDCRAIGFLRNRTNMCEHAFNGVCDEPGAGTGLCAANADTGDCVGRERPREARDHYFERDERVIVRPADGMPWAAVGLLEMPDGSCTASLIGPRHIATAAHCLLGDAGQPIKPIRFRAGAFGETEIAIGLVAFQQGAPDYTSQARGPGQGNGNDWAILTLDRDLGTQIGYIRPYVLTDADLARVGDKGAGLLVSQAGYSWDTGSWLSGHMDCRVLTAYPDGTFIHTCDTTRGDSGSPILTQIDGEWRLIAVDSQFFEPQPPFPQMSSSHLAVDTRAFADELRAVGVLE